MGNFKLQTWHIIAVILIALVFSGIISIPFLDQGDGVDWGDITPGPGPGPGPEPSDMVVVNKKIAFVFIDKYAGSSPSGTGGYLYESDGTTQLEGASNSISSGAWTTANTYQSGSELVVKYVYDTTVDDIFWSKFTVPKMNPADAESLTSNQITIKVFDNPDTVTDTCYDASGNSYADAGDWNKTSGSTPGSDTSTCTYSWYVGTDNEGFLESYDYEYGITQHVVLWVKVFGTNYENVILTGFEGAYEKGSAMYYYHIIDPTEITKYKVGQNYIYPGAGSFSWTVDLSGYSGDAGDMQMYIYLYSDPAYHQQFGSFGPNKFELAEHTIDLVD